MGFSENLLRDAFYKSHPCGTPSQYHCLNDQSTRRKNVTTNIFECLTKSALPAFSLQGWQRALQEASHGCAIKLDIDKQMCAYPKYLFERSCFIEVRI